MTTRDMAGSSAPLTRGAFVKGLSSAVAAAAADGWGAVVAHAPDAPKRRVLVRVGFLSDSHYANVALAWAGDNRYYSASLGKMRAAVAKFDSLGLDIAIEGGDLADWSRVGAQPGGGKDMGLSVGKFDEIEAEFVRFGGPAYHVPGNHDFSCFTPEEFYARVKNAGAPMTSGHYSFARNGVTFVVLDANYGAGDRHYSRDWAWNWADSNVPAAQLAWLEGELGKAPGPCVVVCHEILHPGGAGGHVVKNAAEVRKVIEASGKVKTVLMGHQHSGLCETLNGILYYAIAAQVTKSATENSFAEVDVLEDGSSVVTGYFLARSCGDARGVRTTT